MDHAQNAIRAAIEGRWKEAISENLLNLKLNPKDTESLNRLARAYLETGQKSKSLETYQKVLKIDKFNNIAQKNLQILKTTKMSRSKNANPRPYQTPVFLEEPGVTRTVTLTRLGDAKVLLDLHPADAVNIVSRQHVVCIVTLSNKYIGRLPDDLASRMRDFLKEGSTYAAWIRSIDYPSSVKIFVRELARAPKYKNTPSFPLTEKLSYAAFTPPELIHEEKPDVSATEEQEDVSQTSGQQESDDS